MPPFRTVNNWRLHDNAVINDREGIRVDFGGGDPAPVTNASNGDYDLNFIVSQSDFDHYPCATYIKDVLKSLPLRIDSIDVILADQYLILTIDERKSFLPDIIRRADKSRVVEQAMPVESLTQPQDEIWRNVIYNDKKRQILVVDRLIKGGKHMALVYVLQSAKKGLPIANTFHYDILDRRNVQLVGTYMDYLMDISEKTHECCRY